MAAPAKSGNVWEDGNVVEIVMDSLQYLDSDMLRKECAGKKLITREQRVKLQGKATQVTEHNEHLLGMLEAGKGRSFQQFLEILEKNLPESQKQIYKDLSAASRQYIDTEDSYEQQIQCLVKTTAGRTQSGKRLAINGTTYETLESRYRFINPDGLIGLMNSQATDTSTTSRDDNGTANRPEGLDTQANGKATASRDDNGTTNRPEGSQHEAKATGSSHAATSEKRRVKYQSIKQQEALYMKERIQRRIVILCGNFDTILHDLSRQGIAAPANMAELAAAVADNRSGIYCLTPASTSQTTDPIYMILFLSRADGNDISEKLLRLALEMSRHVVMYFSKEDIMSGRAFHAAPYYTNPDQNSPSVPRAHDLSDFIPVVKDCDVLQLLSGVFTKYPVHNKLDPCHRAVRVYPVLNVDNMIKEIPVAHCKDRCTKLFKLEDVDRNQLHGKDEALHRWNRVRNRLLVNLGPISTCEEFNLKLLGPRRTTASPHSLTPVQQEVATRDPCVNPMWLHSVHGLFPTCMLQCTLSTESEEESCRSTTPCGDTTTDKAAFEGTRILQVPKMDSSEDSTTTAVQSATKQLGELEDQVHLGMLERVLGAWKGPLHVTTVLASKDNSEKFLCGLLGAPLLGDYKSASEDSILVTWHFPQGSDQLNVFLFFNFSIRNIQRPSAAALVFAATALSNTCLLLPSGQDSWLVNAERYLAILRSAVPANKLPRRSENRHVEKTILSGCLLLGGVEMRNEGKLQACKRDLTDLFFSNVYCASGDVEFREKAAQLLSSPNRFNAPLYPESNTFIVYVQLIASAIRKRAAHPLELNVFLLLEYRQIMWDVDRLARFAKFSAEGSDSAYSSVHQALKLGRGGALGTTITTMTEDNHEPLLFSVQIGKAYADVASGQYAAFPVDIPDFVDFESEDTELIKPRPDQLGWQKTLGRRAQEAAVKDRAEPKKSWSSAQGTSSYLLNFIHVVHQRAEADHCARLNRRLKAIDEWVKVSLRKSNSTSSTSLRREINSYRESLQKSARGLCRKTCDRCEFLCLLPRHPEHTSHNCMIYWNSDRPDDPHTCEEGCHLCQTKCALVAGHQHVEVNKGTMRGHHWCADPESTQAIRRHPCKDSCKRKGARGCGSVCSKIMTHDGLHFCGVPPEEHLCNEPCLFTRQCGNKCTGRHGHAQVGYRNSEKVHLCSNAHGCDDFCDEKGVCSIDVKTGQDQYKKTLGNGWKARCKVKIEKGKVDHADQSHSCQLGSDEHFCTKFCRWCESRCTKKMKERHHKCSIEHGVVIHPTDTIITAAGPKKVRELAAADPSQFGNSIVNDSATVLEHPATCKTLCLRAGNRHIHCSSEPGQLQKRWKHSIFWKDVLRLEDASVGDIVSYDGCPERCPEDGHGSPVFCQEEALHDKYSKDRLPHTRSEDNFQYVSDEGHHFVCGRTHHCKKKCAYGHSSRIFSGLFSSESVKKCSLLLGHQQKCRCTATDHVCGLPCRAPGCQDECIIQESSWSPRHSQHGCCKEGEKSCKAPCGIIDCRDQGPMSNRDHRNRCHSKECKPCDNPCSSSFHYHTAAMHHCGKHICGADCQSKGRCRPEGKGKSGCILLLGSNVMHKERGKLHTCSRDRSDHLCLDFCHKHSTKYCNKHYGHAHTAGHRCEECEKKKAPKQGGTASSLGTGGSNDNAADPSDGTVQQKTERLEHQTGSQDGSQKKAEAATPSTSNTATVTSRSYSNVAAPSPMSYGPGAQQVAGNSDVVAGVNTQPPPEQSAAHLLAPTMATTQQQHPNPNACLQPIPVATFTAGVQVRPGTIMSGQSLYPAASGGGHTTTHSAQIPEEAQASTGVPLSQPVQAVPSGVHGTASAAPLLSSTYQQMGTFTAQGDSVAPSTLQHQPPRSQESSRQLERPRPTSNTTGRRAPPVGTPVSAGARPLVPASRQVNTGTAAVGAARTSTGRDSTHRGNSGK